MAFNLEEISKNSLLEGEPSSDSELEVTAVLIALAANDQSLGKVT